LGDYHKTEVRQIAYDLGYEALSKKAESYEICFVPDNDYRGFLRRNVAGLEERVDGGDFVLTNGKVIGKHRGYPFYTIGQRKGLEIAMGKPMFVTQIIPETNTVVLGEAEELLQTEMLVSGLNMVKYDKVPEGMEATTKIRYRDAGSISKLYNDTDGIRVSFDHSVNSIAPGQSAVFYEGDDVIAGGIIRRGYN
jgi:tRNA-specific 2-thiouridylase